MSSTLSRTESSDCGRCVGEIEAVALGHRDSARVHPLGSGPAGAVEHGAVGEGLASVGGSQLTQSVVALVEKEDPIDLGLLGLTGDREDRLLTDVLGLVGHPPDAVDDRQQGEEIAQRRRVALAFFHQVVEDLLEGPLDLPGHRLGALRQLGVAGVESLECLTEHQLGLLGDQFQVVGKRLRRLSGKLDLLASDGDGVVADALQRDVEPQGRGDEAKMPGAWQMPRHERVTELVRSSNLTVDGQVTQDDLAGQSSVIDQHAVHRLVKASRTFAPVSASCARISARSCSSRSS